MIRSSTAATVRPRRRRTRVIGLILALAAAASEAETSVTIAGNVKLAEDDRAVMVDYTGARWQPYLALTGNHGFPAKIGNAAAGVEHVWRPGSFVLGAGLAYVRDTDSDIGTHLNFSLFVELRLAGPHSLVCRHLSHGATTLGIIRDKANSGWTFCGYRLRLQQVAEKLVFQQPAARSRDRPPFFEHASA